MAKEDEKDGVWRTVGGRRIFIAKGQSLTEAMKSSGKFKSSKIKKKRDTKFGDKKIRNDKEFETTRDAMNAIAKQLNETKDPKQKATLERVLKNYTKNLREYQQESKEAFKKKYSESFETWKKANPQLSDDEIISILRAKQYNGELHGNSKNTIPNRFKDGFKVQNSKYSDESKMTLVEDGSGVRLIYDGKDTGTVMKNDLSDGEISRLRNNGKIQNMSEHLERLDSREKSSQFKTKKDYENGLAKISKMQEDGTYDLQTGKSKNYKNGYQVTFSMTNMGFDEKEYLDLVEKFKKEDHGVVDAGRYEDYPEISFNVSDIESAKKLAREYNQKSIWDWKNQKLIFTGGTGEFSDYRLDTDPISKSIVRVKAIQDRILNYEDEIKNIKRKSNLTFTDKSRIMKLEREKEELEKQLK